MGFEKHTAQGPRALAPATTGRLGIPWPDAGHEPALVDRQNGDRGRDVAVVIVAQAAVASGRASSLAGKRARGSCKGAGRARASHRPPGRVHPVSLPTSGIKPARQRVAAPHAGAGSLLGAGTQGEVVILYLVMARRTPQFQPSVIEAHQAFLERLKQSGHLEMSGPFTDKTGGAYVIRAAHLEEAKALAFTDPVHTTKSSTVTVYEWNIK